MRLKSDNKNLETAFAWATQKAKQFVVTGTKNGPINLGDNGKWYGPGGAVLSAPTAPWAAPRDYGAAFWAGYHDRTAYYIRDFVHHATGAALLGMYEELYQMYHTFAASAKEETGWYALWAFNFDHSVYYMDTPDPHRFVREITAQFELVETGYRLFLWTGDRRYIDNPEIACFADHIMTDFIDRQDGVLRRKKNGIPEGKGDIFKGSATYNERGFCAVEAADSIAALYAARCCYTEILRLRGQANSARQEAEKARALQRYFNNQWSRIPGKSAYCYAIDKWGFKHYRWHKHRGKIYGAETLEFIALKNLSTPGIRNNRLLDYIDQKQSDPRTRVENIESLTYLPDLFFANGQPDRAWRYMQEILSKKDLPHEHKSQGANGDYPEIAFTIVAQILTGIVGLQPDPDTGALLVHPQLPRGIHRIEVEDLKYRDGCYSIQVTADGATVQRQ